MNITRLSVPAALLVLTAASGLAQTSQGTIAGTVTDPMGMAVPGATVEAKNETGSDDRTVTTGPNGEYHVDAVTPSNYTVTITKEGFSRTEIKGVNVPASVVTSVNPALRLGSVAQTVTVESGGGANSIQTDSGELSATITTQEVSQLPIVTGNPIDLVLTQPGVVTVSARDNLFEGEAFVVDGLSPRGNNFLIDGFDNNDYGITGQALQSGNLEAIKEVNVQTNSYAPEFGRGGSSVTNVIYKNGTNDWHGAGWERYTSAGINAIPVELKNQGFTVNPKDVNNEFGFDIGGPIVKNKLFIFGSSQWNPINSDASGDQITIPTAAGVAQLQSLGPNQNVGILVSSLGGLTAPSQTGTINIGNRAGCGSPCLISVGQEIRTPTSTQRSYEWIGRGDYTVSDKDTISARFVGTNNTLTPDLALGALPTQDIFVGGPSRNAGVYWTHVLSPTKVNELRFTAQTIDFTFSPLASTSSSPLEADPNITITGLTGTTFGGLNPTFPQGRAHDTYQYQDAFSWTVGNHSLKMGADLIHLGVNDTLPFNSIGSLTFASGGTCPSGANTTATCTALANFVDNYTGASGQAGRSFGSPFFNFPQTLQAYYVQDTWKLRPNLTLTYGLRYEFQGTPLNALAYPTVLPGIQAVLQPESQRVTERPDKNNFGPRFGFAYTPGRWKRLLGDNKTVIRGGFGTFYDPLFSNIGDNAQEGPPNTLGGTLVFPAGATGRGASNALQQVGMVTSSLNPLATVTTEVSNLVNPLIYQWNFDIERSLPGKILFKIAYVGTRGERLYLNEEMNPGIDGVRINPARGSILTRTNLGNSSYNGLDVSVDRSLGHGLMFRGAYTWSKALDNGSDVFTTSGDTTRPQNLFNSGLEKGPSAFDREQRAVITWIYQTPAFKPSSPLAKALSWPVRDWQVSGVFSWQTGAPETVYLGGYDQNGDLSAANDRPNLANPNAPINYSATCLASPTCISGVGQINPDGSLTDWNTNAPGTFNQFRYIATNVLGIGPNGNLGRNTFFNPGRQDYSLALERIIRIPHFESHYFEFRAEAFDVFNHPNAGGGTTQDGSTVPGVSGNIDSATFNNKDVTYEGGRSLYLWLKYRF